MGLFDDLLKGIEMPVVELPPNDTSTPPLKGNTEPIEVIDINRYSKLKTVKQIVGGVAVITFGIAVAGSIPYANDAWGALRAHVSADGTVLVPGQAFVQSVDFNLQPIGLDKAVMNTTSGNVAIGQKISSIIGDLDLTKNTMERSAVIDDTITIHTKGVTFKFDDMTDKLTLIVKSGALSNVVSIQNGSEKTVGSSIKPSLLAGQAISAAIANMIGGALGVNGSEVFGLGQTATNEEYVTNLLESFTAKIMVVEVDKACTPLISSIPNFDNYIKANIVSAMQGELLNPPDPNNTPRNGLSLLMHKPGYEIAQIVADATVEMPDGMTISPDKKNIDALNKLISNKNFSVDMKNVKPIKCENSPSLMVKAPSTGAKK